MCGIETYLDLVGNPLTEVKQLNELEKRNKKQSQRIDKLYRVNRSLLETKDMNKTELIIHVLNLKMENKELKKDRNRFKSRVNFLEANFKNFRNKIPVSKKTKKSILRRDGYKCLCCGSREYLTVDHIIPRSKGGLNNKNNLQTLCFNCNQSKGTKIIDYRKVKPLMVREAK